MSCKSQQDGVIIESAKQPNNEVSNLKVEIPLSDYLRQLSGVTVRGSGDDISIRVRSGGNSLVMSSEPLFLINGNQFNGSFNELTGIISTADIKSVQVYKDASDTSFYGVRGANGVISIKLK
ncbi:hypothetical protein LPB138_03195 [Urechidicola croceus]|uniref:TonB-dependent receptor plug domain-containing protein n=2 Tax=Urechidicola croceus TaxID=1850246 RepID=A0A1D8P586_9FLAO|nr:hypothetical protein LPB138_03195 [Urechidicola croceus]